MSESVTLVQPDAQFMRDTLEALKYTSVGTLSIDEVMKGLIMPALHTFREEDLLPLERLARQEIGRLQMKCAALETTVQELRAATQQPVSTAAAPNLADSWRGVWNENEQYERGHLVTHNGSLWLCLHSSIVRRPGVGDATHWKLIVKAGGLA